jgi:hypothetical protein
MTEKKSVGSKILGIFVESGEGDGAPAAHEKGKTPADIVAELAGQAGAAPGPDVGPPSNLRLDKLSASGAAPSDFDAIFREAGMDSAELDRVKKAEELLRSLPDATPQPVKKQIVEASLKAFGFEVDRIVSAAHNQKRALDAYVRVNETATAKAIQDAEAQVRSFNEKIAGLRADIEKRTAGLSSLSLSAQKRKGEVQKVIDFFQAPATPGT